MSISIQPSNQNLAQSSKFQLTFDRLPYVTFFCQTVGIPGLSIQPYAQDTLFVNLSVPGNKLTYETLDIKFLIDEGLMSWLSVHNWIRGMAFPESFEEYRNLPLLQRNPMLNGATDKPQYSDASFTVYTNKNNPNYRVQFVDCFPISISGIEYNVENTADTILTGSASFKFSYYNVNKL